MNIWIPLIALAALILYRDTIIREWKFFRNDSKEWFYGKWKNWGEPFVIAAILAIIIRTFLIGPYKIPTGSMRPTFMEGDRIFVDKISYRFNGPERGDIIVFKFPDDEKKDFVKRLVGLSGEKIRIKDGRVYIDDKLLDEERFIKNYYYNREDWEFGKEDLEVIIPEGSFFVLGDNFAQSSDSRNWGFVPEDNVVGKAFVIWWPPKRVQLTN